MSTVPNRSRLFSATAARPGKQGAAQLRPRRRPRASGRRSVEGRLVVGEREWVRFLAREITPRFPDGLSVVDAAGQYKTADGRIAHEPSKLVIIVAPEGSETQDRVAVIEAAYKKQFRQQKVVVVTRAVCASF